MSSPEGNRKIAERLKANDPDYYKKLAQKRNKIGGNRHFQTLKEAGNTEELKRLASAAGKASGAAKRKRTGKV